MKNFYKTKLNLVSILALMASLLMQNKSYSQTTLVAGDILFTGYNSIPAPVDNADIISFVLLRDISNNTVINFTDRGYFGNNTWQAVTSTEGTIRWTSGSFLPMGTEVQITALSAQARIPGGSLTSNGTVVKTEHFNSTYNNASTGLLLANTGDQIIAFQGGTSPSDAGVVCIAGLHYTQCGSGGVNTSDNWDNSACFDSPTKSMMPPGLVNGFSAFKTTTTGGTTNNYSGRFQCTGAPYANAATIRMAVMDKSNWLFSNDGAGLSQPSGCSFVATCQAPSVSAHPGNKTICSGGLTTFSVTATGTSLAYQWQVNTGSGYSNISNTGFYSGATSSTLTISGGNSTINGATYRCVITGSCGSATSNGATLNVTTLNLTTSKNDVSCNGGSNGSAQVSVSGGSGFYSYSWSPSGGSGSTATALSAGNYTVIVTDSNGCQNSANVTISQPTALTANTSKTDVSCNGGSNGTATVSTSGGTGPYSYSWAPSGGTNATATGLGAGNYTVTITDFNGCQITRSVTINQPTTLIASTAQNNVTCNGGSNGSAAVSASGGTPGYSYLWSNGATTSTITGLTAGNYSVTITDANACQITRDFTINQPAASLTANASKTDVSCNGGNNGTASVSTSGGTGPYYYSWSPSGGTNATATGLGAGNYTVTITDFNGCQITRSVTINQPTALTANQSQTDVSCNGGSNGTATVVASGGTGPYTYSWSPSGGTAATATGLTAGNYAVTVTDFNGCQITTNYTITQPSPISISATTITNAGCTGNIGEITVEVSGGEGAYTYSWAPSGGTGATASGLAPGTYTVTVTDANTCTASETFEITAAASPVVSIDETASFCEGGNTVLSATATITNTITTEGFTGLFASENWEATSFNSNGSISFNPNGTSVQMISSNGLNVFGYNQIEITIPKACTLSFNWSYETNDVGTQYDYPRIFVNEQESAFQGFGSALSQAGTHSVNVNAGDVIILRISSIDSFGGAATVNITNFLVSNGISYDYLWTASEGGVISGAADQLELTVDTPGVYTLTATNSEGCSTSQSVTVTITPNTPPTGEMYQPLPEGETWTLADLTVSGTNLTWYSDEALTTSVPDTTEAVAEATYYVTQTVNGCESAALAIVIDCDKPIVTLDEIASFCEGGSVTLSPSSDVMSVGFKGVFSSANWEASSENSNGSITFNPDGTSIQMISSNGLSGTGYHKISVVVPSSGTLSFDWAYSTVDNASMDNPSIGINGVEQYFQGYNTGAGTANQSGTHSMAVNAGDIVQLKIITLYNTSGSATVNITNFAFSGESSYDYLWTASEGGVISGAADQLELTVNTPGVYTLTATTTEGCSISKSITVIQTVVDAPQGETIQILSEGQTLADLTVSGTNLTWYTDQELTIEVPASTVFESETTYFVTQTPGVCESQALAITVYDAALAGNCNSFTVWNGTSWSHGTPDITKRMIISGNLTLASNLEACEVLVLSGTLTIPSAITLTVNGEIHNMQEANNFIVESGANLLQIDDVVNIGDVKVKRNVWIKHLDYTIWSSPVAGQDLQEFSPQTLPNRIRVYNGTPAVNTWVITTGDFEAGKGYMFRAPNVFDDGNYPNAYTWTGNFIGVANNGSIDTEFASVGKYQSLGNPYPSNLDRQTFHGENINVGALYFWTNTFAADANGNYAGNNWKVVNTIGEAVATDVPSMDPILIISVGQGFLARVYNDAPEANFNNNMRTSQSGTFYRANEVESHKYWLNLSTQNNILNQTLVSYNASSTNELDLGIDAEQYNYTGSALYSLIGNSNEKYAIQGRALPFNAQDIVPLGFNATVAGSYTISLANFEGLFAEGQNIYLRDKLTLVEHNLKEASYSFVSEAGIFNGRFEVIYTTQSLGVNNPILENSWLVYKNDTTFNILSKGFQMKDVVVYDTLGRVVYSAKDINADNHQFNSVRANQVLIVKVITTENIELTKKVVN